jgi:zinc protease
LLTDTTSSFQPEKLKKYYNRTIAPNSIVMGIYGYFDADKMKELVEAKFSSWKKKEIEYREPELKKPAVDGDIILVHKSDSTQAKIIMGYQFYDYSFKDRIDFLMANRVFGSGGFQSRLMRNLRSEYGYVYAVHSDTDYYKKGGEFTITTGVEPDKTYEVISNIKNEMNKIKNGKEKIKKQELVENINLYNGIFPKYYKTKDEVFSSVLYNLEIRDRGANYLNDFINDYNNITVEKAQQAFEKHTYPAKFFTVIVGNKEDILPSLKKHDLEIKVIND